MSERCWRKSSHSHPNGDCVELPASLDAVRDSKNGDVLTLDRAAVTRLLATVKHR